MRRIGLVVLALVLVGIPCVRLSAAGCGDPVPSPLTAGWTDTGGGTFQAGPELRVVDPGTGATDFKTFRCSDPAMFQGEVALRARLAVEPSFIAEPGDGTLGIHVTISDGTSHFRAVLFREGAGSVRVKIGLPGGAFSQGFAFAGLGADFSMSRRADGRMVLSVANPVAGQPPLQEIFALGDLPPATVQSLEFGTYTTLSSSTTRWQTLGLPRIPAAATTPTLVPVTINAGPGDQNDPHVSGDWVAYTSDFGIRYFNFATGVDAEIPLGPSARDLLSDISGSRIVFSRVIAGVKTAVMVFDAATAAAPVEIDAAAGTTRLGSTIGGETVAYVDFGLEANGELVIHDLASGTSQRITNDTNPDQSPQVAPSGTAVTWEHCNVTLSNCDIWAAVKNGSAWTVGVVADSPNAEANPDTDASSVVYDSYRSSNADIFRNGISGSSEVQLKMPGFEGNPSIAGHLIAFESRPTLGATNDLFVYDTTTNLVYRMTDTPAVTEQLNDITLLPNGAVRMVWASDEDGSVTRNIRGATFLLPPSSNTPPVAVAGADRTPACVTAVATTVTLDGTGSHDPEGDALTYQWTGPFPEGGGSVSGAQPAVTLPLGRSTITLVVNDGTFASAPAAVVIDVVVTVEGLETPLGPLVPEGSALVPASRSFRAGSTLPLRLSLRCGGLALGPGDVPAPRITRLQRTGDAVDIALTDLDPGASNDNGVLFRSTDGTWSFNLSSQGFSTGTYVITVETPDGRRHAGAFVLR